MSTKRDIFFEDNDFNRCKYLIGCNLDADECVPVENQVGKEWWNKWTLLKTPGGGRTILMSDDPGDECIIIRGKEKSRGKRSSKGDVREPQSSMVIQLWEKSGEEYLLLQDATGQYIIIDQAKKKIRIQHISGSYMEFTPDGDIQIQAAKNIHLNSFGAMGVPVGLNSVAGGLTGGIGNAFTGGLGGITNFGSNIVTGLGGGIPGIGNGLGGLGGLTSGLTGGLSGLGGSLGSALSGLSGGNLANALGGLGVSVPGGDLQSFVSNYSGGLESLFSNLSASGAGIDGLMSGLSNMGLDISNFNLNNLGNTIPGMPDINSIMTTGMPDISSLGDITQQSGIPDIGNLTNNMTALNLPTTLNVPTIQTFSSPQQILDYSKGKI